MSEVIGFLGAGQLGEPMVNRLLGAGHEVLVYARRPDVRDRLAAQGATLADTVPELAAASDVLISCLFSDAQVLELGSGPDGFVANAKSDALFVSHTTGTVTTLQDLAATSPTALEVLDAPVSGTADHIAKGELTVLVGGPSEAVERARPVLEAYANPIVATGALGSALSIKLINNLLFAANAQLVAEAARLGRQLGVEEGNLLAALAVCSGGSNASSYAQTVGTLDAFAERATPFLRKDIAACLTAAEAANANLGLLGDVVNTGPFDLTTKAEA
jgi:3-hydroxyisobutyrate dehydrogenase-like beta-hydroxyacid dehydrogenase